MAIPYVVPGADYWQQRALREDAVMDQLAAQAEKNLISVMQDLNEGMQAAVDRFIMQYIFGKPEVAYSDLAKTLQPAELKRYRAAINRLKLDGVPQTKAAAKLANASKKVSRIDALTNELSQWLNKGAAGIQRVMDPQLQATYDAEKILRAGAMKGAGVDVSFTKNSPYQLRSVLSQRWLGSSYSDRIWKQKDALLAQLAKSLPQMFIAGADNNTIAKELQRVTGVSQAAANRLIRTEGAKVATQADLDLYKDAGLGTCVYVATIDGRTSEICRQMNGKTLEVSKLEPGVTAPPLHPNCRSTTVPDVDTSDIDEVSVLEAEEAVAKKYGGIARPRNADGVIVVDSPDVITKRLATVREAYASKAKSKPSPVTGSQKPVKPKTVSARRVAQIPGTPDAGPTTEYDAIGTVLPNAKFDRMVMNALAKDNGGHVEIFDEVDPASKTKQHTMNRVVERKNGKVDWEAVAKNNDIDSHNLIKLQYELSSNAEYDIEHIIKATDDEKEALTYYTGSGYVNINRLLSGTYNGADPAGFARVAEDINRLLQRSVIDRDMVVYRGTRMKYYEDGWEIGDVHSAGMMTSTTLSRKLATDFNDEALLEIRVPKGTKGLYADGLSRYKDQEAEVLLPPSTKFKVVSRKKTSNGVHIVLEVVS